MLGNRPKTAIDDQTIEIDRISEHRRIVTYSRYFEDN